MENEEGRILDLFAKWKPPAGVAIKAHYVRADGGGLLIIDAESAVALLEGNATWQPFHDYETTPIVEVGEAVPALRRAVAWRESNR
jgi:hypothetical protein